jgi:SAM-dependent methyltransferase
MAEQRSRAVNAQYNVAAPDSLAIRLAHYQRRHMFARFLDFARPQAADTVLDVGATSDQTYAASNYLAAWYPHKDRVTACGLDDAAFLEQRYPGLRFVRGNALALPFADGSFDFVHSSAVIEHVGSFANQRQLVAECARVARKGFFITTPNRWFPVEFHTVLPLLHWLPKPMFRACLLRLGLGFFADEANLNLLSAADLRAAAKLPGLHTRVAHARLLGVSSNLLLEGRRPKESL